MWVWYDASGGQQFCRGLPSFAAERRKQERRRRFRGGGRTAQGACGPLEKPRGSSVVRPEIASFLLRNPLGRVSRPWRRKARPRPPIFVRRPAPAGRRLGKGFPFLSEERDFENNPGRNRTGKGVHFPFSGRAPRTATGRAPIFPLSNRPCRPPPHSRYWLFGRFPSLLPCGKAPCLTVCVFLARTRNIPQASAG